MKRCKFEVITLKDGYYLYSAIWEYDKCVWNNKEPCDDLADVFTRMQEIIDMSNGKE